MNIRFDYDTITKLIFIGFLLGIGQITALALFLTLSHLLGGGS